MDLIELYIAISQNIVVEIDHGTFAGFKSYDGEDDIIDPMYQLTKFAFDASIAELKHISVVVFIDASMNEAAMTKTCGFFTKLIDDELIYSNLIINLEMIVGQYENDEDTDSNDSNQ